MLETLFGGLLGGVFRIVPEVLKFADAKNDRAHELAMQDKQLEFEKLRGAQRMDDIHATADASWQTGTLEAFRASVEAQGKTTGIAWVDALSTSVRPVITYWFMGLYCATKTVALSAAVNSGQTWAVALAAAWTDADQALWAGILNFWFLGRVFDKALK